MLRPTVSRPVCLGIKHPSGAYSHFYYCQAVAGLLMRALSLNERTVLSFTIAAGPRQRSHSRSESLWTGDHILLSQYRDKTTREAKSKLCYDQRSVVQSVFE
jgi:hypothetical protein